MTFIIIKPLISKGPQLSCLISRLLLLQFVLKYRPVFFPPIPQCCNVTAFLSQIWIVENQSKIFLFLFLATFFIKKKDQRKSD